MSGVWLADLRMGSGKWRLSTTDSAIWGSHHQSPSYTLEINLLQRFKVLTAVPGQPLPRPLLSYRCGKEERLRRHCISKWAFLLFTSISQTRLCYVLLQERHCLTWKILNLSITTAGRILWWGEQRDLVVIQRLIFNFYWRYQDDVGMGVNLDDLKRDTKPFILTASAQSNRDTVSVRLNGPIARIAVPLQSCGDIALCVADVSWVLHSTPCGVGKPYICKAFQKG